MISLASSRIPCALTLLVAAQLATPALADPWAKAIPVKVQNKLERTCSFGHDLSTNKVRFLVGIESPLDAPLADSFGDKVKPGRYEWLSMTDLYLAMGRVGPGQFSVVPELAPGESVQLFLQAPSEGKDAGTVFLVQDSYDCHLERRLQVAGKEPGGPVQVSMGEGTLPLHLGLEGKEGAWVLNLVPPGTAGAKESVVLTPAAGQGKAS